jgi:hypothetical protein
MFSLLLSTKKARDFMLTRFSRFASLVMGGNYETKNDTGSNQESYSTGD